MNNFNEGWKEQKPDIIRALEKQKELIDSMKEDLEKLRKLWISFSEGKNGSNYSQDDLKKTIEELNRREKCEMCDGLGWDIYNTSPEGDKDICHICFGEGVFYILEIK
jgi:hypothetical protein